MPRTSLIVAAFALSLASSAATAQGCTVDKQYADHMAGFWLGQSIANWTGLVTEMDKIGVEQSGQFYTRDSWQAPDEPNIWSENPSDLSATIDWVLVGPNQAWGSDDDTDIEYIYQHLIANSDSVWLTPQQIADGWLRHIWAEEENYLWVSNQRAFDLISAGTLPPATSDASVNEHTDMIDAQLTTEIFGTYAPCLPERAVKLASLPISVSATGQAAEIAKFYVRMHAYVANPEGSVHQRLVKAAGYSRGKMQPGYAAKMYDFVQLQYQSGATWEQARDAVYQRYQVDQQDGYDITSRNLHCNGCFAAGINYAASLVSLFYGEGDYKETVKIAVLSGWDADNPAATWGGLLGYMLGNNALRIQFKTPLSDQFNIARTRQNFEHPVDRFSRMADEGTAIAKRVIAAEPR